MSQFSRQDSNCSARGCVAAEGRHRTKNEAKLENVPQPVSKMPAQALEILSFFLFFPQAHLLENCLQFR